VRKSIFWTGIVGLLIFLQGCSLWSKPPAEQPVKLDNVISKVKIESLVCRQETNWVRVTGDVKNTSEYPVTAIEGQVTLTGDGKTFDSRLISLSLGKRLEPGETLTFDSTLDYGNKEIPQVSAEAKITKLQVLSKTQTSNLKCHPAGWHFLKSEIYKYLGQAWVVELFSNLFHFVNQYPT